MPEQPPNSLLRNLGQFVGHIAHAVKTDPTAPPPGAPSEPAAVRTTVEERVSPDGTLILRRTTIDEIAVVDGRSDGTNRTDETNTTERTASNRPQQ